MSIPKPDAPTVEFTVAVPVTRHDGYLSLHFDVADGEYGGHSVKLSMGLNGTAIIVHTGERTYIVSTLDLARQIAKAVHAKS